MSRHGREQRRLRHEAEMEQADAEERRYADLSMYEKIEEAKDIHDIKRILHELTEERE